MRCLLRGSQLHFTFCRGSLEALADWQGLQGYNIIANIMGYPGRHGVFTVPTPINEGLVGLAGLEDASFIGYIAEGTGAAIVMQHTLTAGWLQQPYMCQSAFDSLIKRALRLSLSPRAVAHIPAVALLQMPKEKESCDVSCAAQTCTITRSYSIYRNTHCCCLQVKMVSRSW